MAEGGWKCCCCTVAEYDWPYLCAYVNLDAAWWNSNFREEWRIGNWYCDDIGGYWGPTMVEHSGTGRLICNVPLSKHQSVGLSMHNLVVGDSMSIFLGWIDASNYIEVRLSWDTTVTCTLAIVRRAAGVDTSLESCTFTNTFSDPVFPGSIFTACLHDGYVIGWNNFGTIMHANVGEVGQYTGFSIAAQGRATDWGLFTAMELDPPEYRQKRPASMPDVFCGACLHCACGDDESVSMPVKWDATLLLHGDAHAISGSAFTCTDTPFCAAWDGLAFQLSITDHCTATTSPSGYWRGWMPDPVGQMMVDNTKYDFFQLSCPNTGMGSPWDYVGPWEFGLASPTAAECGVACGVKPECTGTACCFQERPHWICCNETSGCNDAVCKINRDLSTCDPLVIVFDGVVTLPTDWDQLHRDFPLTCTDAYRAYHLAGEGGTANVYFRLTLTAAPSP